MGILEWLKVQGWKPWIGNAILAVVVLILTAGLGGMFIPDAIPFASVVAVLVFFGLPELRRLTPNVLKKFVGGSASEVPYKTRLFRLSGAAVTVLAWAVVFWL